MDILRDSVWQFWGVIVAIIGVVLSIMFFLAQKNRKRLAYQVLTDTPLLSVSDEIKGKIKIEYDDRSIQNIHLVMLKIENIGNIDIAASEYEKGIVFNFPNSEILSAEVSDALPKNLKPVLKIEPSSLIIDPIMLNKKDHIVCKIVFANFGNVIEADARILGVKDIERAFSSDGTTPAWMGYLFLLIAVFAAFGYGSILGPILDLFITNAIYLILFIIFSLFSFIAFVYFMFGGIQIIEKSKPKN